jgi:putative transposase
MATMMAPIVPVAGGEAPYQFGQHIQLVVDPHTGVVMHVENDAGQAIGMVTELDPLANSTRRRQRPPVESNTTSTATGPNLVELAHRQHYPHTGE